MRLQLTQSQYLRGDEVLFFFFFLRITVKDFKIKDSEDKHQKCEGIREAPKETTPECFVCFAEQWQSSNHSNYEITSLQTVQL